MSWLVTGNVTFIYLILNLIIDFNFGFVDIVKINWSVFLWTWLWYVCFEKHGLFIAKVLVYVKQFTAIKQAFELFISIVILF